MRTLRLRALASMAILLSGILFFPACQKEDVSTEVQSSAFNEDITNMLEGYLSNRFEAVVSPSKLSWLVSNESSFHIVPGKKDQTVETAWKEIVGWANCGLHYKSININVEVVPNSLIEGENEVYSLTVNNNFSLVSDEIDIYSGNKVITKGNDQYFFKVKKVDDKWKILEEKRLTNIGSENDDSPIQCDSISYDLSSNKVAYVYNRTNAVIYAHLYWTNYNPAYRSFSNDCTNFGSQTLYGAGFSTVLGLYSSNNAWWYVVNPSWPSPGQSYTWAGAQNLYNFLKFKPRATQKTSWGPLQNGDIIFADWPSNGFGTIEHTMIVTGMTSNGPLLTYHSNNRYDNPLTVVTAASTQNGVAPTYYYMSIMTSGS
jgi:hypothetical protein